MDPQDTTPLLKRAFYDFFGMDSFAFHIINRDYGLLADKIIYFASVVGDYIDAPFYFLIFLLAAGVHNHALRHTPQRQAIIARQWRQFIICTAAALCASGAIIYILKITFYLPRPFMVFPHGQVHIVGALNTYVYTHTSFPSGHAGFAATLAFSAWPYVRLSLGRIGLLACVALAMWARVAAGLHFPVDVACGALVGWLCTLGVRRLLTPRIP